MIEYRNVYLPEYMQKWEQFKPTFNWDFAFGIFEYKINGKIFDTQTDTFMEAVEQEVVWEKLRD